MMARTKKMEGVLTEPRAVRRARRNSRGVSVISLEGAFRDGHLLFGLNAQCASYLQEVHRRRGFVGDWRLVLDTHLLNRFIKGEFKEKGSERILADAGHRRQIARLRPYRKRLMRPGGKCAWPGGGMLGFRSGVVVRRICKLMITEANKEHQVHVMLDGLDQERVCSKQHDGSSDAAITNAEVRAAFRAKNPFVFFYKDGMRVRPPWEDEQTKPLYDDYQAARSL